MNSIKEIFRFPVFIILVLVIHVAPLKWLAGQNTGPVAPETMAFEPVDATDMVNLLTGDFSYVLPLFEIPSPEGGFPIALSYHGGITMDQEASWVGLGWNINPGAINRGISGIADDVKDAKIRNILYDSGEEVDSYYLSAGVGYGSASIGVSMSWGSHQSSYGSVSLGYRTILGTVGVSIGNKGVGLNLSPFGIDNAGQQIPMPSLGLNYDYQGEVSYGMSYGIGLASLGINFNSQGIGSITGPFGSIPLHMEAGGSSNYYSNVIEGFEIMLVWKFFNVHFRYLKELYSFYQMINTNYSGSLYLEYARKSVEEAKWYQDRNYAMDTYYGYHEKIDDAERDRNSLMFPAYDYYSVSAQGLGGTISPRYFEFGSLVGNGRILSRYDEDYDIEREVNYNFQPPFLTPNEQLPKTLDSLHFYFDYENSSYLEVRNGDYILDGPAHDPIWDYNPTGGDLETVVDINGEPKSKYVSNDYRIHRKGSGKFIEWITNEDIYNNVNLIDRGFIETPSITDLDAEGKRDNENYFDPTGIGAINITTEDGKTYHYSLPVYQYERFIYDIDLTLSIEGRIVSFDQEERGKYAYTWLLTAITGPDFIDNGNGMVDESDYGYWVRFDYGKWSDGYIWKIPYDGLKKYTDDNGHEKGTYSWGRKQIYYLNNITTRTHTAYFIKNERTDAYGSSGNLGHGFRQTGKEYKAFAVPNTPNTFKLNGHIFLGSPSFGPYIVKDFLNKSFNSLYKHEVLRLDKIILVSNKDKNLLQLAGSEFFISENPLENAGIQLNYQIELFSDNGSSVGTFSCIDLDGLGDFSLYFKDNIFDINDLEGTNIEQKAIKIIDFNYNFLSCLGTPNTEGGNSGKLTLHEVQILGVEGDRIMPPYTFIYKDNQLSNYDNNRIDEWGFDKNYPDNWSLNEIITPIGSKISIEYEPDEYSNVAIGSELFLQKYLGLNVASNGGNFDLLISQTGKDLTKIFNIGESFKILTKVEIGIEGEEGEPCDREFEEIETNQTITAIEDNKITFSPSLKIALNLYSATGGSGNLCDYRKFNYSKLNLSQTNFTIPEGGLRVKKISVNDELNNSYSTYYDYSDPTTGVSSGITSYAPLKDEMFIPYVQDIPSPGVMYEYVKVESEGINEMSDGYTTYKFEVLKACTGYGNSQIRFGNQFEVVDHQNSQLYSCGDDCAEHYRYWINARNSSIIDKTASIGRVLEQSSFNSFDQLISQTKYNYKEFGNEDIDQGVTRETFMHRKSYCHWSDSHVDSWTTWFLNSSSKKKFPNVLESISTYANGFSTKITNNSYDFITGQVLENTVIKPNGELIKNTTIPAYSVFPGMGSKIDDTEEFNGSNMLVQSAAQYSYVLDENMNEIGAIAGSVQIWNNKWNYREFDESIGLYYDADDVHDVWRKQRNYIWKGELDENGSFSSFEEFDFSKPINYNEEKGWSKSGEITRYNHYSLPFESKDINNNYSALKVGYYDPVTNTNEKLIITNSDNARYTEFAFSGAEDELNSFRYFGGEVNCPSGTVIENSDFSHTGQHAVKVQGAQVGFRYTYLLDLPYNYYYDFNKNYIAEVWVYNNENFNFARLGYKFYVDNVVIFEGDNVIDNADLKFAAGNWRLLSITIPNDAQLPSINLSNANRVEISVWNSASLNSPIYFDDFRIYPVQAEVSSYIYDDLTGSLNAMIDKDNIASLFDYDAMGRLLKTRRETGNGIKLSSESKYNYSRQFEYSAYFEYYPTIVALGNPITFTPSNADLDVYTWKFSNDDPFTSQNPGGVETYIFNSYGDHTINLTVEFNGVMGSYSKIISIEEPIESLSISPHNAVMTMKSYTVVNCETAKPWQTKTFIITNSGNTTISNGTVQLAGEPIFQFCPNSPTNFDLFPGQSFEIEVFLYPPQPGGNEPPCEECMGIINVYNENNEVLDFSVIHANIIYEPEE